MNSDRDFQVDNEGLRLALESTRVLISTVRADQTGPRDLCVMAMTNPSPVGQDMACHLRRPITLQACLLLL